MASVHEMMRCPTSWGLTEEPLTLLCMKHSISRCLDMDSEVRAVGASLRGTQEIKVASQTGGQRTFPTVSIWEVGMI